MEKFKRPTLVTLTAPTCAGKDYLLRHLCERFDFITLISCTSRPPRKNEINGREYYFISKEQFEKDEAGGVFCEAAEFRGTHYGVTWYEFDSKVGIPERAPIVILEPSGLEHFQKLCVAHDYDIFKIYVHASEETRQSRLIQRTVDQITAGASTMATIVNHTDRLVSMMSEERRWSQTNTWDAIVPGTDVEKAMEMVEIGIRRRNRLNETPTAYHHKR